MRLLPATSAARIVESLRPGMTVYVPGMSGESLAFFSALKANAAAARDVRFVGVHFPGINHSDYLSLHPRTRQRAYFMQQGLRAGLMTGRVELVPSDYPGIFADLAGNVAVDIAVAQITPPDDKGLCSLGPCQDFLPALWSKARRRVGHVNPLLPRTRGSFAIDVSSLDAVFEEGSAIATYDCEVTMDTSRQAALVAELVRDGDTIECGVGKIPSAVLAALVGHRRLRFYSGMASTPVLKLIDCGAVQGAGAIQIGAALGDSAFYDRLDADETFLFRPVSETHDVRRLGAIDGFCAINSAIEVDLCGQVNADGIDGRLVAGVGGLPAFASGARLAKGGRSIIALPATSGDGKRSRIVPMFGPGSCVTLPRHEADYVVTEHGVARLRGRSLTERATELIAVAAPQFRDELARAWELIARRF